MTLRASYDFDGISGAQDFIPATIAVPGTYATRQKFGLDEMCIRDSSSPPSLVFDGAGSGATRWPSVNL